MSASARRRRPSRPAAPRAGARASTLAPCQGPFLGAVAALDDLRAVVAMLGALVVAIFLAPGVRAASAPPFLPLDDVRPGMVATVRTVLRGTEITEMKVEIVSVIHDTAPQADIILAKGVGEPIRSLGVAQGMSGSPAYVDGKLVGAVASTWSFLKEPMFGITPVQQMERDAFRGDASAAKKGARSSSPIPDALLGAPPASGPFSGASPLARWRAAAPTPRESRGFTPIGSPLVMSGFDRRLVELAADLFAPWGLTVAEGGAAGHEQKGGAIEPGATLGVRLAGGDVDMTAIGAVTWVDGDKVYGWGHPFFQRGEVELPLVSGWIHTVVPSEAISFKLGSGAEVVGTITNDRRSGIAGRLGVMPRLTQMDLAVTESGGTKRYHYELVRDRTLSPVLVGLVSANSISAREGGMAEETVRFRQRLVLDDGRDTVVETVFAGDQTLSQTVDLLSQAAGVIVSNPFEEVALDRVEAEVAYEPGIKAAVLTQASLDDDTPEPGDVLQGTYALRDWRGEETSHRFRIPLPPNAREGRYLLLLADASTAEQYESERDPRAYRPQSLDELLDRIRRLKHTDELHIHLYRQSKGVLLDGRPLADLPPSRLSVMRGPSRSGNADELPAEIVYQSDVPLGKLVQGAHTILFEVRKEKP